MKSSPQIFRLGILGIISLIGAIYLKMSFLPVHAHGSTTHLMAQQNTTPQTRLVQAYTRFGLNLFKTVHLEKKADNVLISPHSVALALSLLYNGADGKTQQEMNQALTFQGMSLADINQGNQKLQKRLDTSQEGITVHSANSLWVRQGFALRHAFLRNNRHYYQAEVTNLNFQNPQAVGIINRWVSQQTQGKITQIIEQIKPENVLFLINALYFKGDWQSPFDADLTQSDTFNLGNSKTKQHPFMAKQGDFFYQENNQFQAISLPYGNGDWRFDLFLPRENQSLNTLINQLNETNWTQWVRMFRKREGLVKMPRFRSDFDIELNSSLKALGMKTAFMPDQANFSQMTSDSVVVDTVKHKTFIEVNEKGTEAAASTSIGISVTSALPSTEPFTMIINRPFFYTIRDSKTGVILLMGTMINP